jgi:glycosyltransferase involved in cell wall biosynthesis
VIHYCTHAGCVDVDDHDKLVWDTTVVIPTHPARGAADDPHSLLGRAVASVLAGDVLPQTIAIAVDHEGRGAGWCRQQALDRALEAGTKWVSFLDSDDTWYPNHLAVHKGLLIDPDGVQQHEVAYSWFDGNDPFPMHRGRVWNPKEEHHTTMTITVDTDLIRRSGACFVQPDGPMHQEWSGEDWQMILALNKAGGRFIGTGEITWTYHVHAGNTSGLPTKGDAAA